MYGMDFYKLVSSFSPEFKSKPLLIASDGGVKVMRSTIPMMTKAAGMVQAQLQLLPLDMCIAQYFPVCRISSVSSSSELNWVTRDISFIRVVDHEVETVEGSLKQSCWANGCLCCSVD